MSIDFLRKAFARNAASEAIVWRDRAHTYAWLQERVDAWRSFLESRQVQPGAVAVIEADFSPNSIALFLAAIESDLIIVPLTAAAMPKRAEFLTLARAQLVLRTDARDEISIEAVSGDGRHEFYSELRARGHAGLVLFSSGSTGKSKGVVHDWVPLLEKFKAPRHSLRTVSFLLYDHIGGINTLLYTLANGGCLIAIEDRTPDGVLAAVERHRAELLPTSPTFLNLVLIGEAHRRHNLDSLRMITYGTETMPENTLRRFHDLFPKIQLVQTYGLSELGILHSKSRGPNSLWVKIGGQGFETRVINGILQIKAQSAMLGYLNADSPFTADGWFNTGDMVEVDGDYYRILGRVSEIINVGGEKVYPAEVESVIEGMENVTEAVVYGEKNPITGSIVCARVRLAAAGEAKDFPARLKAYCRTHLQPYKVPVKVTVTDDVLYGGRFKKQRQIVK